MHSLTWPNCYVTVLYQKFSAYAGSHLIKLQGSRQYVKIDFSFFCFVVVKTLVRLSVSHQCEIRW